MKKTKKRAYKILERFIIIFVVIIVTSIIVKATDNIVGKGKVLGTEEDGPCEPNMIFVSSVNGGFCIDQYEASAGSNCPSPAPRSQADTAKNIDTPDCKPASNKDAIPWRNISQNQAALACAKAGKRLPSNKEWYLAALGTPDKLSGWNEDDCQVSSNWSQQPGPTGSGINCVSSAGIYDMIGNVWEWIDGSVYNGSVDGKQLPASGYIKSIDQDALPSETSNSDPDEYYYNDYFWIKTKGTRGIARGGYWDNEADAGQYALYAVTQPSFAGSGVGFRCAK